MIEKDITKKPKRNAKDIAHAVVKSGLSTIPVLGGPASELFTQVITPSLAKRRDEWLESVAKKLKDLEDKTENFKMEDLQENESFISTIMQASRVAMANHHKAKREALQNAVLKAALPGAIADDLQLMFLIYIDFFTPRHLELLKFFKDFRPRTPSNSGKVHLFFVNIDETRKIEAEQAFPGLSHNENIYNQVFADLFARGLIAPNVPDRPGFLDKVKFDVAVTSLGQQFLDFITSPTDSKDENNTE